MFTEAFVQEVIADPSTIVFPPEAENKTAGFYEKKEGFFLKSNAIPEQELLEAPYNSLIVRLTESPGQEVLAYPLLQNHFALPVKAGESVWVMEVSGRYHWLCRKNFGQQLDDVSKTVSGRFKQDGKEQSTSENAKAAEGTSDGNVLPKDINTKILQTLPDVDKLEPEQANEKYFDYIGESTKHHVEPIPRYKKRPGDLVIQGSSNTLISLGTGGGHLKEKKLKLDTPSVMAGPVEIHNQRYSGTIDLVTGRGRHYPKKSTTKNQLGDVPQRTASSQIISESGEIETDKNLSINKLEQINNIEGDPDFGFDASRIYISTNAHADINFSLKDNYPKIPGLDFPASPGAGIVLKSDHLRIVARNHIFADHFDASTADGEDINGSIRLVKEGTRDGSGHSTLDGLGSSLIAMESDGTVMIDGSSIVLGTGRETSNGAGDHVFIGAGATEPLVLGNELKTLLTDFFTALELFLKTKFDTHFHPTGVGPSGPPTVIGDNAGTATARSNLTKTLSKIGMTR